ncbi:dihydropteroate synthase [Prevotella sp. CAG:755]|nr:dihydropteroate synthase [Prevotella sp. CAG:755]
MTNRKRTLNIRGRLMDLSTPRVMGILNVTPDSFYAGSRTPGAEAVAARVRQIRDEGADFIDIGAYSSRPGAADVPAAEEMERLRMGLGVIAREAPEMPVSVDTFRADVARMCVEEYGVSIINDIAGGQLDAAMFDTVARLGVPYVLMHMQGTPQTMQREPHYDDVVAEVFQTLARGAQRLHAMGAADVILDPGFGFGKTVAQNYDLLAHLDELVALGLPVLVGVSRKSMIWRLVGGGPEDALNGTTAIHAIALMKGASILRVHDVKAATEAVKIVGALQPPKPQP